MTRSTTLAGLALVSALALAGCAGDRPAATTSPEAATAEATGTAGATASASAVQIAPEHNDADVVFAQMMIPHHEQAVEMSEIVLGKDGVPDRVRDLAGRVIDTQQPEIDALSAMLVAWDAPAEPDDTGAAHGGHGGGMMTAEDLAALQAAGEGSEAARLYLQQMTEHHEGAVEMAQEELSNGENPQALELAQQVVEAQEAEIREMDTMLQDLGRP